MLLSDDDLLDFEVTAGAVRTFPRTLLDKHGDARTSWSWPGGWRAIGTAAEHDGVPVAVADAQFEAGALETLSDIAANLRHGDFLPGGSFYEEAQKDAWPAVVGVRPR